MKSRVLSRAGCLGGSLLLVAMAGCSDEIPTSTDPGLIPVTVETFEVTLPFEDFGRDVRIDGGYGSPSELGSSQIIYMGEDDLEVRPLIRFLGAPAAIVVFPPGENQTRPDSSAVPIGGRITVELDSARFVGEPPFDIRVGALTQEWDHRTASWTHAVDTLGAPELWTSPGGGEPEWLDEFSWSPDGENSFVIELDSAMVAEWADSQNFRRGMILSTSTPGSRLRISSASLEYDLLSEVNPDTTVTVTRPPTNRTMILDREPDAGDGRFLVGGAPAFRSTFRIELPDSITTTGAICDGAPTCRVALTADRIVFAGMGFQTIPQEPPSLAPADSLVLDLRPVLAPERLPRSPLGTPILPQGRTVGPDRFEAGGEGLIEIPVTRFLRSLAAASADDGTTQPSTVSLISAAEPSGLGVASFGAAGTPRAPVLRIILTATEGVTLP